MASTLESEGQALQLETGVFVAVIGAAAGLLGSFGVNFLRVRVDRRRDAVADFSKALADALEWVEFIYIINRRDKGAEARGKIRDRMNDLQQRLTHHQSWLRIESSTVHAAYKNLVEQVMKECMEPIRTGWEKDPIETDSDMNLRGSVAGIQYGAQVDLYVDAVKKHLRWYWFKGWF